MKWNSDTNKPVIGTFQGKIDTTELNSRLGYYFGSSDFASETKRQVESFISEALNSYTKGNLSFSMLKPKLQRYAAKILFELRFPYLPYEEHRFICDLIDNCKIEYLCRLCYCDFTGYGEVIGTPDLTVYRDFLQFIADGCIDVDYIYSIIYPLHRFFTLDDYKEIVDMSSIQSVREEILKTIIDLQEENGL